MSAFAHGTCQLENPPDEEESDSCHYGQHHGPSHHWQARAARPFTLRDTFEHLHASLALTRQSSTSVDTRIAAVEESACIPRRIDE